MCPKTVFEFEVLTDNEIRDICEDDTQVPNWFNQLDINTLRYGDIGGRVHKLDGYKFVRRLFGDGDCIVKTICNDGTEGSLFIAHDMVSDQFAIYSQLFI